MTELMLDIETLGTTPDSAVISIGAVAFTESEVIDSAGWPIRHSDWHGHIDPDTVKWWMGQNEAARNYSFHGECSDLLAAFELANFIRKHDIKAVWANDPDFDVVILKNWWRRVDEKQTIPKFPFRYDAGRSYRTMKAEAVRLGISYGHVINPAMVAHHPVDDAAHQARVVNYIRNQVIKAAP